MRALFRHRSSRLVARHRPNLSSDSELWLVAGDASIRLCSTASYPLDERARRRPADVGKAEEATSAEVEQGASPRGYRGFGSFHSENVEEMIEAACRPSWTAPEVPPAVLEAVSLRHDTPVSYGAPMRQHFLLSSEWTFLNHGAFGSPCRAAYDAAAAWRLHAERQPLAFIDRALFAHVVESQRQLAAVVGASPRDLALLPNATTALTVAISAACDAANVREGDEILLLDVGYGSVSKMTARECKRRGARMVTVNLLEDLPSSANPEALLGRVQEAICKNTKVAIFDHVSSNTAMQLPVSELAATCRTRGVVSIVDGAHSLGCTRALDVQAVGADYFCGNLHKWLCNVRGSGFLVLRPSDSKLRSATEPLIASHGYGGGFTSDFIWQGASDYSPWLAVPSCLEWWRSIGGIDQAVERNHELLVGACELLSAEWQTQPLLPSTGTSLSMALMELPLPRKDARGNLRVYASRDGKEMQDALFQRNIECPIKTVNDRLYARISAAVYNEIDEYDRLAHAVQAVTRNTQ